MATRISAKEVHAAVERLVSQLIDMGLEKPEEEGGAKWRLQEGSPSCGQAWRLYYTPANDSGAWGPDFADYQGYIGSTAREAWEYLCAVSRTLGYVNRKLA